MMTLSPAHRHLPPEQLRLIIAINISQHDGGIYKFTLDSKGQTLSLNFASNPNLTVIEIIKAV